MKEEQFKEMYNTIKLNNRQKEKILACLAEEPGKYRKKISIKNKFHMPAFTMVCIFITFVIGVPVIAASTGLTNKIIQAFNLLSIDKPEITNKQKNIYSEYGNILDNEIQLEGGTLKLDAVICDKNYMCIPFSITQIDNTAKKRIHNEDIRFYMSNSTDNCPMGMIRILPPEIQEDGSLRGCYLLAVQDEIKPGDKLLVKRAEKWDDDDDILISEFDIKKIAKSYNIPVDTELIEQKNMNLIYNIELSPLSLKIEGNNNPRIDLSFYDITVELKDGTIVKETDSGSWGIENENHNYIKTILFAAPVDVSEVAGVRIKDIDGELWIPAGKL